MKDIELGRKYVGAALERGKKGLVNYGYRRLTCTMQPIPELFFFATYARFELWY